MRRLVAAFQLLASTCCGGSPLESSPAVSGGNLGDTLRVSGVVRDFSTGDGVAGVTVAFGDATSVTNRAGAYSVPLAAIGTYYPTLDGARVGTSHITGASYRGDFFVKPGTCVARYGTVSDIGLHKSLSGVLLSLGGRTTMTGADGWYRLDYGCPTEGWVGFNTIFIYASHPDYADTAQIVGRGIAGVARLDIEMQRK